ncbi:hypothetical protein KA005_77025 [bacterium]|nr:hypothetical protein [bacterium]
MSVGVIGLWKSRGCLLRINTIRTELSDDMFLRHTITWTTADVDVLKNADNDLSYGVAHTFDSVLPKRSVRLVIRAMSIDPKTNSGTVLVRPSK